MASIGYIRVSTLLQNTERQLANTTLDKIFEEKVSAKTAKRPILIEMIDYLRDGDILYVHDISRLARNMSDLHNLVEEITGKGVTLKFVSENLTFTNNKSDPTSQLLLSVLGAVYSFERNILLERQREGIKIAKEKGKFKGRKATIDKGAIIAELDAGLSIRKTASKLGVSVSSVQRAKG